MDNERASASEYYKDQAIQDVRQGVHLNGIVSNLRSTENYGSRQAQ